MNKFKRVVLESIKDYLPSEYNNAEIRFEKIKKNNGLILDSVIIKNPNQEVVPNIYVNSLYEDYVNGRPLDDILTQISSQYKEACKINAVNAFDILNPDNISDNIILKVINKDMNKNLLGTIPYREQDDLLVTYRYLAAMDVDFLASTLVTNEMLENWGISEKELYNLAIVNTQKKLPVKISNMEDVILGMMNDSLGIDENELGMNKSKSEMPMYIVSNEKGINGATTIIYPGVMNKISELLGGDYFVLPSSIHEIIVVPFTDKVDTKELGRMVQDVNSSMVTPDEVLSNNVYHYSSSERKLTVIKNKDNVLYNEYAKDNINSMPEYFNQDELDFDLEP